MKAQRRELLYKAFSFPFFLLTHVCALYLRDYRSIENWFQGLVYQKLYVLDKKYNVSGLGILVNRLM